jgi:hypothetical protein
MAERQEEERWVIVLSIWVIKIEKTKKTWHPLAPGVSRLRKGRDTTTSIHATTSSIYTR